MMIANNEMPPYKRLAWSVTDGRECLRSYNVLVEKSDRKRSTASSSLRECQRVNAPTPRVAVNSKIKILDRFCISQDSLRRTQRFREIFYAEINRLPKKFASRGRERSRYFTVETRAPRSSPRFCASRT